jgi:hydrogenase maturation protein HypF
VETVYPFKLVEERELIVDWRPMIKRMIEGLCDGESVGQIAAAFHNTLAEIIVAVAQRAGVPVVVLTGGCFQNKYLLERSIHRLREESFQPAWPQRIPPNDGGIALGQVVAAARAIHAAREKVEVCAL